MNKEHVEMLKGKPSSELWSKERQNTMLDLLLEIRDLLKNHV